MSRSLSCVAPVSTSSESIETLSSGAGEMALLRVRTVAGLHFAVEPFRLCVEKPARSFATCLILYTLLGLSLLTGSQAQTSDPNNDTGIHPYETYEGARENINLGAGNVFVSVPLLSLPGRSGHNYLVSLISNSQTWSPISGYGQDVGMVLTRPGSIYFHPSGSTVLQNGDRCITGYALTDEYGGVHTFGGMLSNCGHNDMFGNWVPVPTENILTGGDDRGEGYGADLNACKVTFKDGTWTPLVTGSSGCPIVGYVGNGSGADAPVITDTNGNQINLQAYPSASAGCSRAYCGGGDVFPTGTDIDTLGRSITYSGSNHTIQYKDSNGVPRTITFNVQSFALSSCIHIINGTSQPQSGSVNVITSVVLPNGLTYVFHYDQCGNTDKIVYPSGGYTRYVFDYTHYTHALFNYVGPFTDVEVTAKYVCRVAAVTLGSTSTVGGNTCPAAEDLTTYNPTLGGCNNSASSVTDPLGNRTSYQFINASCNPYTSVLESSRQIYQGSSTLLRTIQTTYVGQYPASKTTILPNGLQSRVEWDYWSLDFVHEKREFAWAPNGNGSLVRKTDYGSYCYTKPSSEIVYDGAGIQIAKTTYEFDNYTAGISSSGAVLHNSTYNTSFTNRCNVTAVNAWRNTDGATLTTRYQYDDAGNRLSATAPSNSPYDSLTRTTTYSYADVWNNTTCTPTGGKAAAYPTQVTDPGGLVSNTSYNSCSGTAASATDANNQVTTFAYDLMDRRTSTIFADTGQTSTCFSEVSGSTCYSNSYPLQVQTTQKITSSMNKVSTVLLDGLARVSQTQLNSDPDGVSYVDTTYDGNEKKSTVSNPHLSTSGPTDGTTTYQYDALGRITKVIPPDGTGSSDNASTTYDVLLNATPPANCTTVIDQAGKSRKSCSDALGRLTQVFEDPGGLNYETDYQYDLLNNLIRVDQKGSAPTDNTQWRTRTFAYNSLSQLLCSANPELALATCPNPDNGLYTVGTVRYAYDNLGNLITKTSPKPNQTSSSVTVQTTYTYEIDNRLTKKSYNDGATPTVQFAYDGGTLTGCTINPPVSTDNSPKGRRTSMCDGSGATSWTHDEMGRVLHQGRSTGSVRGDYDNDTYNLDGSIKSITSLLYGVNYTYNAAGRPIAAKNSGDPFNYVTSAHYAPFGGLTAMSMGAQPITISNSYNKRLQPTTLSASTTAATIISLGYDFHLGTADNGNVFQIVNNRDANRTQNFTYDSLNRIQQAWTSGPNWGETYGSPATNPGVAPPNAGIDAWGNLFQRSGVAGKTWTEPLSCLADKQNHLTTCLMNYDAAGNMISNASVSYTYDAENRLIATAGMSYLYDGDGERVEKCTQGTTPGTCATNATGTLYWTGTTSDAYGETDLAGNLLETYVFFNGKRIARRDASTKAVHYYFSDHLGTHSLITDAIGTMSPHPQEESDFYPYGGEIPITTGDPNHYKFTGKERDNESGLDDFGARFDASALGRFMSVDRGAPSLTNPLSLNAYAYSLNNPLRFFDPDGNVPVEFATYLITVYHPAGPASSTLDALIGLAFAMSGEPPANEPMEPRSEDNRPGSANDRGLPMSFGAQEHHDDPGFETEIAPFRPESQSWSISVDFKATGAASFSFDQGFLISVRHNGPPYTVSRAMDEPQVELQSPIRFFNLSGFTPGQLDAMHKEAFDQYQNSKERDVRYKAILDAVSQEQLRRLQERSNGKQAKCKEGHMPTPQEVAGPN